MAAPWVGVRVRVGDRRVRVRRPEGASPGGSEPRRLHEDPSRGLRRRYRSSGGRNSLPSVQRSGKMSPEFCRAGADAILPSSCRSSPDGKSPPPKVDGRRPDSSQEHLDASAWVGECLTLNIPEFNNFRGRSRSEGSVLSLRDILETGELSEECSLTGKCVAGILRRAAIREDLLPKGLAAALANASRLT